MTVGSFKAKHDDLCAFRECARHMASGALIYYKHKAKGYFCSPECLAEVYPEERENTQHLRSSTPQQVTTTATVPWSTIESDAAKGHRENMESAKLTRDCLANLTVAIITLRDAIEKVKR